MTTGHPPQAEHAARGRSCTRSGGCKSSGVMLVHERTCCRDPRVPDDGVAGRQTAARHRSWPLRDRGYTLGDQCRVQLALRRGSGVESIAGQAGRGEPRVTPHPPRGREAHVSSEPRGISSSLRNSACWMTAISRLSSNVPSIGIRRAVGTGSEGDRGGGALFRKAPRRHPTGLRC